MVEPILLSLQVACIATLITSVIGIGLSYFIVKKDFVGKSQLETFLTLPMVLPPSVLGYGLLVIFGREGWIGKPLFHYLGIQVIFTITGAVIAAVVVSLPLMIQNGKAAFTSVDPVYEKAAATLGAGKMKVFFTVLLPLSWPSILSGILLAFARALGEFGATLMIAGNIPGRTQTIPLAIYFAVDRGDYATVNGLVAFMTILSFLIIWLANRWLKKKII